MCEGKYRPIQFDYVIYEHSSGDLSVPDCATRFSYYEVTAVPTLLFDGKTTVVGGSTTGAAYMPVIDEHHAELVPLAMAVTDWDFAIDTAFAEVRVMLFGDLDDTTSSFVRIALMEDNVVVGSTTYRHILRDLLPDQPLTIALEGQEQIVNVPLVIDPAWNQENLLLLAWVQRDTDKYVFNSASSRVGPYAALAGLAGPRQKPLEEGAAVFDPINLFNMGLSDDVYEITLDTTHLPAGWSAYLTHEGQTAGSLQLAMDSYEMTALSVTLDATTNDSGYLTMHVYSQGADEVLLSLGLGALAAGAQVLIVSDDALAGHAYSVYGPLLAGTNLTPAIWERNLSALSGADLQNYEAVIWTAGANTAAIQANDRAALDVYLDSGGGRLIMAGENLLQGIIAQGTAARNWFLNKFRFNYSSSYSGSLQIIGIADDPIGDGLDFTLTGGNPDRLVLLSGEQPVAVSCIYGLGSRPAVMRTFTETFKSVFMPFGLELVPDQENRGTLLKRSLEWLDVLQLAATPDAPAATMALLPNRPNPFNPATEIAFSLGKAGPVRLEVYNARGQLVRVLVDETLPAGQHTATWNGRTTTGAAAASGTYFCRLSAAGEHRTRKMSLLK